MESVKMAEGIVISVVANVLLNIGSAGFQEAAACWGVKADVAVLRDTITMIKAVLLDAQRRQEGSEAIREWLRRLREVVYEADDLFEEIRAIEGLKDLMEGNRLMKEIRVFFTQSNMLLFSCKMARKVKAIRGKMDRVKSDMELFKFNEEEERPGDGSSTRGTPETGSFVVSEEIIGRESDKEKILGLLLDSKNTDEQCPDVVPILGFGGLGKTALAQLIYNDEKVGRHFELRAWACISDITDIREKLIIILQALYVSEYPGVEAVRDIYKQSLDDIQLNIRRLVCPKTYLLVLDDVWDEDYSRWIELRALLSGGKSGSKIIVTTRLMTVAETMGTFEPHQIEGLASEKAWTLFEKIAFKPGQKESNPGFVRIAKEIIGKCKNVPLAIKSVASLLRTKDSLSQWESINRSELLTLELNRDTKILPILKLSYDHMPSHLKQCFAFCALYEKDFEYHMIDVVGRWMAQGFIQPHQDQNPMKAAMECYNELIKRSFFQDVKFDSNGDINHCKMHDLVHDLARYVAGNDSFTATASTNRADYPRDRIHHVAFHGCIDDSWNVPSPLHESKHLRTIIKGGWGWGPNGKPIRGITLQKMFSSFKYLRMLEMIGVDVHEIPNSFGQLKHLRYVMLYQWRNITYLPKSFTRLYNLQTLVMGYWASLKALPRDFHKLVNLVSINIGECHSFTHMPPRFGQLTKLERLSHFILSKSSSIPEEGSGLVALDTLTKLCMPLHVVFREWCSNPGTANMQGLLDLEVLTFQWYSGGFPSDIRSDEPEIKVTLPPNLKRLTIDDFPGMKLPHWGVDELPSPLLYLASIQISNCKRCIHLPSFSQLPSLEELNLVEISELKYIQIDHEVGDGKVFFSSLRRLKLVKLPKIKAWSPTLEALLRPYHDRHQTPPTDHLKLVSFPELRALCIQECRLLESLPFTPHIEHLEVDEVKETLKHQLQMSSEATEADEAAQDKGMITNA